MEEVKEKQSRLKKQNLFNMSKLDRPLFTDRRKKPVTVKGTKTKNKDISFSPVANPTFKKGGFIARGCGKVMKDRKKVTKVY